MSPVSTPVRVIFVAGTGRSGSTILSNALAQLPGALGVGEVRYTWERGMARNHLCGCGLPFDQCGAWTDVTAGVFSHGPRVDPAALASRLDNRLRARRLPRQLARRLCGRAPIPPHCDDAHIQRLYAELAKTPDVRFVVDSSKLPSYAALVERLPGVQLHLIHLVRDPRAASFSWRRVKATTDANDDAQMPRLAIWRSALDWLLWNALIQLWWPNGRRHLVRYEDFAAEPAATLRALADELGLEVPTGLAEDGIIRLEPTHSVAGNPDRLRAGAVRLSVDTEWQSAMSRSHKTVVTLLTLPMLHSVGYCVRAGRRLPDRINAAN